MVAEATAADPEPGHANRQTTRWPFSFQTWAGEAEARQDGQSDHVQCRRQSTARQRAVFGIHVQRRVKFPYCVEVLAKWEQVQVQ